MSDKLIAMWQDRHSDTTCHNSVCVTNIGVSETLVLIMWKDNNHVACYNSIVWQT